jgi:hypothetical protein
MSALYRVTRKNDKGEWVPVRSAKAGARETTYADYQTAKRAMSGYRGSRYQQGTEYRVESTSVEWLPANDA